MDATNKTPPELPEFRIRLALPWDLAPFAPHFQMAFQFPTETRLFVIEDILGKARGGGYLLLPPGNSPEAEVLFDLHIFAAEDFAKVGGQLLNFFEEFCRVRGRTLLAPSKSVVEKGSFDHLLKSLGFEVARVLNSYVVETDKLLADFEPAYQRLIGRQKIPREMKIFPLREAPFVATQELIRWTIGSNPIALERQMGDRAFCEESSKVARVGPTVVGTILVRFKNAVPEIVYLAVEPNKRNSWVYVALCAEFLREAQKKGCRSVGLKTFNRSVMHSAERAGGEIIGREFNYQKRL